MGVTNGIITTPISITDVRAAIGDASYDLGTLCKSSKINKWAKYKPVRLNAVDVSSQLDSSKNWKSTSTWWKASDGSCGLSIPTYSSVSTLKTALQSGVTWGYNKPTGGSSQPYRISDFISYLHSATCPFGTEISKPIFIDDNGDVVFELEGIAVEPQNLQLSDLAVNGINFADMYAGVILTKGNSYQVGTSSTKLGSGNVIIEFTGMSSQAGIWQAGLFLCSSSFSNTGNQPAATFVPFPIAMQSVSLIKASGLKQVVAYGTWNTTYTQITFNYLVINDMSSSQSFTGITVMLYRCAKGGNPIEGDLIQTLVQNQSVTVPGNDSYESNDITVSLTGSININNYDYALVAKADNVTATYNYVEESSPLE